jgi:hypothetical protein
MSAKDKPLGDDSFSWDDAGEGILPHLDGVPQPSTENILARPSESLPRGLDGGRPSALGIDRRTPELRERDVLEHRARIDEARRLGLFETEEALDSPSDLDPTWKRS